MLIRRPVVLSALGVLLLTSAACTNVGRSGRGKASSPPTATGDGGTPSDDQPDTSLTEPGPDTGVVDSGTPDSTGGPADTGTGSPPADTGSEDPPIDTGPSGP